MIGEYLAYQEQISQRANYVGRSIQAYRHYAIQTVAFPAAVPRLHDITNTAVVIIVGMDNQQEWVCIHVPIPLFENGSDSDLRVWVTHQNTANDNRVRDMEDVSTEKRRAQDIDILKELMAKYPDVVSEGV